MTAGHTGALRAPFPFYGGKSTVSGIVWPRFGDVRNYVEPFCGSLAMLLGRPANHRGGYETVNDVDCHIVNFWRAMHSDPNALAKWADWPVNEADMHARMEGIRVLPKFRKRMHTDPDFYDVKIAGWWVWEVCTNIGGVGGMLRQQGSFIMPSLAAGEGVHRKSLRTRYRADDRGERLREWFGLLAARLRDVRVCCGDWKRVCGHSPTTFHGVTAVFLDPPYGTARARDTVYAHDTRKVSGDVQIWCAEHGTDPKMLIALCGYEGEHNALEDLGWSKVAWKAQGGYGNAKKHGRNENRHLERIWFSPACLVPEAQDAPDAGRGAGRRRRRRRRRAAQ